MVEERGSSDHGELRLPESLQGLVAARLDGLSAEEKALVQDAAGLGKVVWGSALAALDGRERWTLEEALHVLERKQFVLRQTLLREGACQSAGKDCRRRGRDLQEFTAGKHRAPAIPAHARSAWARNP